MAHVLASSAVRRLRARAATAQADAAIGEVETRLARFGTVPLAGKRDELAKIAAGLNALRPLLDPPDGPVTPFGKLSTAIAPGMGPKPAARRERAAVVPSLPLDAPVTALPRVGEAMTKDLVNLGVRTVGDLLRLAPRRHIDYSKPQPIGSAIGFGSRDDVTVRGHVVDLKEIRGPGKTRVQVKLADDTGWVRITWFNPYIARQLTVGDEIAVSGKLEFGYGPPSFNGPEWEKVGIEAPFGGRLTPVYPLTKGVAQKTLRRLTRAALDATAGRIPDFLPTPVRLANTLPPLPDAFAALHYPDTQSQLEGAQTRLAFDDLFLLQLGMVGRKRARQALGGIPLPSGGGAVARFVGGLPYRLTGAQERALAEVLADMEQARPMTRLLQGDVGSGKTVVAAAAALVATANGHQAAVMAPTEILAEQHFHNFRGLYAGVPVAERPVVALLTGSTKAAERRRTLAAVAAGDVHILVGTHALIQGGVAFHRLGLTVVDEQHRFGVRQRAELPGKGGTGVPHTLAMTATPIPRTLNMVLNGDLDVSVLDELPPGRIPIETQRFVGVERDLAYDVVREQVALGHQVFVICPLVEESETVEAKAAVAEADRLQREVFPQLRVALLHGRMSGKEKDATMTAFRDAAADVLVSTSVIEVGIDVPNATVMLIEGADRFGLSQLHQFRGRVGRGGDRSYCLLLADEATPEGEERLQTMVATADGFKLAEKDLELRGPGDFVGTRQSGLPEMAWIDGSFDTRLLDRARQAAEGLLADDPGLARHPEVKERLTVFWEKASPDLPLG